jgi:AraC-like DNA-binding protein
MLHYLEARGVSTERAQRECGISIPVRASGDDRIAGSRVERLWALSLRETGDPLVGLHMAEAYNPGTLDILGYVILSCHTIGDVFDRFSRYARLLNDGVRAETVRERATAHCRITLVDTMDNYLNRDSTQAIDATWGSMARELGRLATKPLCASEVWFRHAAPSKAQEEEYRRVLNAPVRFGAPEDRFIVPLSHLDEPVRSANRVLLQVFEAHADGVLSRIGAEDSRSGQVAAVLARRIKGTVPTLGDVARELAMSERNLQRALRDEGTSFQKLVDELRRELAISHLANPETSAGQIGFLLGFSEPSAFHRAFRRWTGQAPGAYRTGALGAHGQGIA